MSKREMRTRLKVKEIAESKGLNRAKLARQADLTYDTLHAIWNDPFRKVSMETLLKLARALNVDVSELYEEVPD